MSRLFHILMIGLLGSLFLSTPGRAAATDEKKERTSSFSITPLAGAYRYFSSASPSLTPTYGLKLGYDIIGKGTVDTLGIEGTVNYFSTKVESVKTEGFVFRADAVYSLSRKKLVPFVAIGLGDILIKSDSGQENTPLFNYGVGLKYFFEDYLAWRLDVRHLLLYKNVATRDNFEVSTGLTYVFGVERKKPKKQTPGLKAKPSLPKPALPSSELELRAAPPLSPEEEYSYLEKLGLAGTAIAGFSNETPEFRPAPAPEGTPSPKELPHAFIPAPATAPVLAQPAPTRAALRAAPQPVRSAAQPPTGATPPQVQRSSRQAAAPRQVHEFTVQFDLAKVNLRPGDDRLLRKAATLAIGSQNSTVRLEDHSDASGDKNLNMSQKRAEIVKKRLVALGVSPEKITTIGQGTLNPALPDSTGKGRKKNRRSITITIVTE